MTLVTSAKAAEHSRCQPRVWSPDLLGQNPFKMTAYRKDPSMLTISKDSTPSCLVIEVSGAVTGDEIDDFSDKVEDALEKQDTLNLVVNIVGSVKYGDFDAMGEDLEFGFKEYRKIRRAAFVGDQKLVRGMLKLFSPFTRAKEEFFAAGELAAAIEWASAPK